MTHRMRWLALALFGGCGAIEPMSDKLTIVPLVNGLQAPGKALLNALVTGDFSAAEQAVTADYRCDVAPDLRGAAAARAQLEHERRLYPVVLGGGHFKVRKLLAHDETTAHARCERRMRGTTADGQRFESIAVFMVDWVRDGEQWRIASCVPGPVEYVSGREPLYEDFTVASGIQHTFHERGKRGEGFFPGEHDGGGIAAVDLDGDGDVDLLLTQGDGVRVYVNLGNGKFEDRTAQSGLTPVTQGEARGLCCVDFDGDGHRDLFLTVHDGPNQFWRGGPGATFRNATDASDLGASGRCSTSAAAGDLDGDGDLDLYVCNYGDPRRVAVDWLARNGEANTCWRNDGNGRFTEVAAAWGVADTGYSLSVAFADADNDGDLDCYVANDFAFNRYFRNRGDGTFEDASAIACEGDAGTSMGVTWADLDGDGDLDCYVSNMFSSTGQWIFDDPQYPVKGFVGFLFREKVLDVYRKLAAGNSLLRNDGDHFTLLVAESGAANAGWAWSAPAVDADGDGRTDLFVVNGMLTGADPTDT